MTPPKSPRIRLLPLLLEAFFVVLGVALAFAVNEWREHRNQTQHASMALETIRSELAVNQEAIEDVLTYHLQLADTLHSLTNRNAQSEAPIYPDIRLFTKGYVAPATLRSTAWEAANATDAVTYMDYNDVLLLSGIYAQQHRYEYQAQQSGQLIYTKLFNEGHVGMQRNFANLNTIITAFWYEECVLLNQYQQAKTQLMQGQEPASDVMPDACQRVLRR